MSMRGLDGWIEGNPPDAHADCEGACPTCGFCLTCEAMRCACRTSDDPPSWLPVVVFGARFEHRHKVAGWWTTCRTIWPAPTCTCGGYPLIWRLSRGTPPQ